MSEAVIAIAGSPNTGKTSLFNALTGSHQKTGNYPGVTVERKFGDIVTPAGHSIKIVDLPGTYGFTPMSLDEKIAVDVLTANDEHPDRPDIILAIADSTNLERSLRFVLELKALGKPIIVALNMMDLAQRRGLRLDVGRLEKLLGAPVVPTVAVKRRQIDNLLKAIDNLLLQPIPKAKTAFTKPGPRQLEDLIKVNHEVKDILRKASHFPISSHQWTRRLDRILLHPYLSGPILMLILFFMFQAVFSWAEAPMGWIEAGIALFGDGIGQMLPDGLLRSLIVDGVIAGVGAVLVFLPQILLLFTFIYLLESSGYMMRAAYILDKGMAKIGLPGLSLVPLISSFACAIPGIMAARTIKDPRDRLLTILISPLMTCSARLPVYVLLIGAFIPARDILPGVHLQGLVMFGLFLASIVSAVLVTFASKFITGHKTRAPLMLDLPTYKWPDYRNLLLNLKGRTKLFLKRAGKLILVISIGLWVLSTFPRAPEDWPEPAITYSIAGRFGKAVEPLVKPIGFDWRIATGLVPGFAAREVMVSAMGTVFAIEHAGEEEDADKALQAQMAKTFTLATGISLLVWYIFSPQCLSTFAVMRRETNSWKWPVVGFSYMLLLAYLAAFASYQICQLFVTYK